ncbi:non-heme iron oxygenase ferredoxin subunit [Variovorax sp. J31P207]|uniref:non-heme iron oxygenase ferredoxin subunit n=1 Tax=Variovorax sp. J31P207 TaxID=3053510 RepID=UPI002578A10A|nr:non-heme iron oxygenase ferredoxin subunit [Variovorax sp. J31P207]MDM0065246.1 non-heme iron oxygenase ferredoxin subunit [Variovorax sp. J31P207]
MTLQLITACEKVTQDAPFAYEGQGKKIAIYRVDGEFFATDNVCPHAYALLTDGFVEGDTVECPLHGALFNIRTGKCMGLPAESDLATYPVTVVENKIFLNF